ncbi:MAG: zf-HC2 domain-containing protein [Pyrinomonadaceae bacterium]
MNGKCFEIGTIQAFLDGETTPDTSLRLTNHVAGCDTCARMMADADEENSIVFSTLERELNTLVPTQRLWSRINETIEVEKSRMPIWHKVLVYLKVALANPSLTAAAGILLMLGMFAVIITVRDNSAREVVVNTPTVTTAPTAPDREISGRSEAGGPVNPNTASPVSSITVSKLKDSEIRALAASVRVGQREIQPRTVDYRTPAVSYGTPAADTYLAGEESYVKTISDLKQNVDSQTDVVMTPSSRVSYERDLAVVNDSILRMREVVKKNPRNQAARRVLYSSYQDKIDLLNSVAQREELMASLSLR